MNKNGQTKKVNPENKETSTPVQLCPPPIASKHVGARADLQTNFLVSLPSSSPLNKFRQCEKAFLRLLDIGIPAPLLAKETWGACIQQQGQKVAKIEKR
jgi:hypothetical protein